MKTNIVAIGGGDIRTNETLLIDQTIVQLADKSQPQLLFIPTASSDNATYCQEIAKHFGQLSCTVDTLCLYADKPSVKTITDKIATADIIYVGGGNTLKMMMLWRKLGIDMLLAQAHQRGTVLCGISAGSICWFNHGNSDSRKFKNPNSGLIRVRGLGFIDAMHCPHYLVEPDRRTSLFVMVKKTSDVTIALDDNAALHVQNDQYRIIKSVSNAGAYKVYWKDNVLYEEPLEMSDQFQPLSKLLYN